VHDSCENKLQVSQKTRNYWKALRLLAFLKQSSMLHMADHRTYWCIIYSSSLTHSLHFRSAMLHLLTTRSKVNIAACHHPFIVICCDKLIIGPVAIITVPVTATHMLWIIHTDDSRAGEGPICCSSITAMRINVLMLVKHRRVFRASAGYTVNKPIRTSNCHQHT